MSTSAQITAIARKHAERLRVDVGGTGEPMGPLLGKYMEAAIEEALDLLGDCKDMASEIKRLEGDRDGWNARWSEARRQVNHLNELREGDFKLTRALAEDAGVLILAADKFPGLQWEQLHTGVMAMRRELDAVKAALNCDLPGNEDAETVARKLYHDHQDAKNILGHERTAKETARACNTRTEDILKRFVTHGPEDDSESLARRAEAGAEKLQAELTDLRFACEGWKKAAMDGAGI